MPHAVVSKDGTRIAYQRLGTGDLVVIVGGVLNDRKMPIPRKLTQLLSRHFTVVNYDRRGKGDSSDAGSYSPTREIEDIGALLDANGGTASLVGISSGGALAAEAARALPGRVKRLAIYELPFIVDHERPPVPDDYVEHMNELIRQDKRSEAGVYFMRDGVRLPALMVWTLKFLSPWKKIKAYAPTLAYDLAFVAAHQRGKPLPDGMWADIVVPTLVVNGSKTGQWMHNSQDAIAALLPNAERLTLQGESHIVRPKNLAPPLVTFFSSPTGA